MILNDLKDVALLNSSLLRRFYGAKLYIFGGGNTPASQWFISDHRNWNNQTPLDKNGYILDVGAFKGDFTKSLISSYPDMKFVLFEPLPTYAERLKFKFKSYDNVKVIGKALSSDGRGLKLNAAGLRSRESRGLAKESIINVDSINIGNLIREYPKIELLKLNIEGMEYECLEKLVEENSLINVNFILVQFHDFFADSSQRRDALRQQFQKNFTCIYSFDWMWELWHRND
jgi:FkbM family methyltransferase